MVEVFGLSDVGCIRELNEDCYCICGFGDNSERGFCILADGMGGHNAERGQAHRGRDEQAA